MKKSAIFLLVTILVLSLAMSTVLATTEPQQGSTNVTTEVVIEPEPQEQTVTITTEVPEQGNDDDDDDDGNGGNSGNQGSSKTQITVNFNAGGSVSYGSTTLSNGSGVSVTKGDKVSFKITPNSGYKFKVYWNGVDVTSQVKNNVFTTPAVDASATLRVEFLQGSMPPSTGDAATSTVIGCALLLAAVALTVITATAKKRA